MVKLTWLVLGGDPAARSHRVESHDETSRLAAVRSSNRAYRAFVVPLLSESFGSTNFHLEFTLELTCGARIDSGSYFGLHCICFKLRLQHTVAHTLAGCSNAS